MQLNLLYFTLMLEKNADLYNKKFLVNQRQCECFIAVLKFGLALSPYETSTVGQSVCNESSYTFHLSIFLIFCMK